MEQEGIRIAPSQCPVCSHELLVTRLECPHCGTDVVGTFSLSRLASLREPHASLIELFLRKRGNMKDMERELGISYPTVRARLEEALEAAGLEPEEERAAAQAEREAQRMSILEELERGEITAEEAHTRLLALRLRR